MHDRGTVGQFWYYHAPGSGIWLNIGRSLRMESAGVFSPGCQQAVSRGYDTISLSPDNTKVPDGSTHYGGISEIVDCRALQRDPISIHLLWQSTCPPANASGLRAGIRAPLRECHCNNSFTYIKYTQISIS